ncbi:MAG: sugar phosphate nucleotidyltransferase [Planctomycetota bacterium]
MTTSVQPTLLVIAAGMGSRYGGLKQIDSVGPTGEIIIDYSMFDAVKAGFKKIVFVIRHYFEDAFREKIGNKLDGIVDTAYAYQELNSRLDGFPLPPDREKPWGTGHAILVAKDLINEPFAVINADDYYGRNSLKIIADYLAKSDAVGTNDYAMVGFTLRNTLSKYGTVARGVCQCDDKMFLTRVIERTKVEKNAHAARYYDPDGTTHPLTGDETVSMNLWGFQLSIFGHLQRQFKDFLRTSGTDNKAELYIPFVVDRLIQTHQACVKVLPTHDTWFGVTYRQDRQIAAACINRLIDDGIYPARLWSQ